MYYMILIVYFLFGLYILYEVYREKPENNSKLELKLEIKNILFYKWVYENSKNIDINTKLDRYNVDQILDKIDFFEDFVYPYYQKNSTVDKLKNILINDEI